jgi:thiamine-monophosphate kinase
MRELDFIKELKKRSGRPGKGLALGIGDDCAAIEYDKKHYLLWASDMLIEGTHFNLKKAGYKKVGQKAVLVNISDIASMGGTPKYITVSIGVSSKVTQKELKLLYDGIFDVCKKYKIKVVGGDTNKSNALVIDVSIMGLVEKKKMIKRSGAKTGDFILVTGPVRSGRKEHLDFTPRLKEANYLTSKYKVSSMIDTSDGLAMDAGRIASESRVGARLYEKYIPLSKGLTIKDALYYGESFELLFTLSAKETKKLFSGIGKNKKAPKFFIIGEVIDKKDRMQLVDKRGNITKLDAGGFCHL